MLSHDQYFNKDEEYLVHTYKRLPVEITHGERVFLFSSDGKKYLDFFSGLAVNALGYGNKKIIDSIEKQLKKYIHISNYYINSPQIKLAEKLIKYSGLSKVFFANSGTEAIEASLKIVRKINGPNKEIISFSNAFHGRTYGSLSIGGKEKYKKQFSPLLPKTIQVNFNDVDDLKRNINNSTAAVYIEFIQGEGGIQIATPKFVKQLNELRKKYGFVIVADEIQTGLGRTGKAFAFNHYDFKPDMIVLAKAIGGGLPLSALLINQKYSDVFQYGDHGSTFGGNPVACAAGLAVIDSVFKDGFLKRVEKLGRYFKDELKILAIKNPAKIAEVRSLGFMIGVEIKYSCDKITDDFLKNGVLVNCTNSNVLRILPPLISTRENIDHFLDIFNFVIEKD